MYAPEQDVWTAQDLSQIRMITTEMISKCANLHKNDYLARVSIWSHHTFQIKTRSTITTVVAQIVIRSPDPDPGRP